MLNDLILQSNNCSCSYIFFQEKIVSCLRKRLDSLLAMPWPPAAKTQDRK
ncbi:MAG: hypothetical protein M2R45_03327 [Verrucomicrobia subdivision 3 bacterium]|nr:hypothetical protein [Limisphaerales bacterium]MCS1415393.1 hypothetical protein [Limisphaerales bacterium]